MNPFDTTAAIVENAPTDEEAERVLNTFDRVWDWDWQVANGWLPLPNGRRRMIPASCDYCPECKQLDCNGEYH